MILSELFKTLATESGVTKTQAKLMYEELTRLLHTNLQNNGEVTLHNIGTWKVKDVAARKGRNPKTGEALDIPASKKVKFQATKSLKDLING